MVASHALIRLENVGLRYGVGQEILRDINFHLQPGSFHFLTGASGAGKTTLLRMLFMSLRPTRGLVIFSVGILPRIRQGNARI